MEFDLAPGFYSLDKLFPHLYEALEFHWITVNRALTVPVVLKWARRDDEDDDEPQAEASGSGTGACWNCRSHGIDCKHEL